MVWDVNVKLKLGLEIPTGTFFFGFSQHVLTIIETPYTMSCCRPHRIFVIDIQLTERYLFPSEVLPLGRTGGRPRTFLRFQVMSYLPNSG